MRGTSAVRRRVGFSIRRGPAAGRSGYGNPVSDSRTEGGGGHGTFTLTVVGDDDSRSPHRFKVPREVWSLKHNFKYGRGNET